MIIYFRSQGEDKFFNVSFSTGMDIYEDFQSRWYLFQKIIDR